MAPKLSAIPATLEMPSVAWKRALARRLSVWYPTHKRELPWRVSRDAYRVWISEIMLQQTQVATVVPYFTRFIEALPTVAALAAAEEHEVLRLWEGLGYYRRARQMHQAARLLVARHGGKFPRQLAELRSLPGVGRYTAGAIVSMAFDRPAPILEANTVRLLSRLVGFAGQAGSSVGQKALWSLAETMLPSRKCGAFNEALMELGALVCTPKRPLCGVCPVRALCAAFRHGRPEQFPQAAPQPRIEAVREGAVVAWYGGKVFVRRCRPGERWAGLWDFLRFPLATSEGTALGRELVKKVREQAGLAIGKPEKIVTLKHGVTRFRITLDCYQANCRAATSTLPANQGQWIEPAALAQLPLSVTGRKLSLMLPRPARSKE